MARPRERVQVGNADRLIKKLGQLGRKVMPQVQMDAIRKVTSTLRAEAARDISKAIGTNVGTAKRRIRNTKRPSKSDPSSVLEISGKALNLVEFVKGKKEARSPRGGITANAWGRKRKFPGVFLAKMPNGEVIAVKRSAPGKRRAKLIGSTGIQTRWAGKSPHIEAVWGPSIPREAAGRKLREARERVVRERMPIEMKRAFQFRLSKLVTKRGLS